MAYIDAQNAFCLGKTVASSITTDVIDLGTKGAWLHPLYIDAKLSTKMTSGSMDSFTVQSASDKEFTSPVNEVTITVSTAISQTAKPQTLAQFVAPIRTGNRYVRVTGTGTSPSGGKLDIYMTNGIKADM